MKKGFLIFALLLMSASSFAARIDGTSILGLQNLAGEGFIITLPSHADNKCSNGGVYFYVTPGQSGLNSDSVKVALSIAIIAYSTGNRVNVVYDDTTSACFVASINVIK